MKGSNNGYGKKIHHRVGDDASNCVAQVKRTGIDTSTFQGGVECQLDRIALKCGDKNIDYSVGSDESDETPI